MYDITRGEKIMISKDEKGYCAQMKPGIIIIDHDTHRELRSEDLQTLVKHLEEKYPNHSIQLEKENNVN